MCKKIILQFFLQDSCKLFMCCKKSFIFSTRLARYVQDLHICCKTVFTGIFNNDSKYLGVCCKKRPTEIHHILFPPPQIKSEKNGLGTRPYQAVYIAIRIIFSLDNVNGHKVDAVFLDFHKALILVPYPTITSCLWR